MQSASHNAGPAKAGVLRWPVRILGPVPGLKEIHLACWGLFAGLVAIPVFYRIWLSFHAGLGIRGILPVDFLYFYGDGIIVNRYSIARLYDYALQLKVFNEIYPVTDGAYGPSPYPPWIGLFFSGFARLPLAVAYLVWMGVSLALYLAGIAATIKAAFRGKRLEVSLIFCCSLAFFPFMMSNFANGQLSSIAIFSVGLALYQERRSRFFASGLALSILAYKPTLLLIIVPMLLLTRRFRTLFGFVTGVAAFVLATTALAGAQIWPSYLHFLTGFGHTAGINGQSMLLRWKYVDLISFSYAFPGDRSAVKSIVSIAAGLILGRLLLRLWMSAKAGGASQSLAWAVTLTWTLLFNVYVPIYDSVLVIVALILTLGALRELAWLVWERRILWSGGAIFAVSWFTVSFAKDHRIQLITVALCVLGWTQLHLLRRAIQHDRLAPSRDSAARPTLEPLQVPL